MHSVVLGFLSIIAETRDSQECDAVIGGVVRHPRGALITELNLRTDGEFVPFDHFIEAAGLDRDVMQCWFDRLHDSSLPRRSDRLRRSLPHIYLSDRPRIRWQKLKCDSKTLSPTCREKI